LTLITQIFGAVIVVSAICLVTLEDPINKGVRCIEILVLVRSNPARVWRDSIS
jgi:hypothetical protein